MEKFSTDFPCENDRLYVREESPFEYLYAHIDDEEGADFLVYFDSLLSDTPIVYKLSKIEIPLKSTPSKDSSFDDIEKFMGTKENNWKRVKMINSIIPGEWKNEFAQIRNIIINKLNSKKDHETE